MAGGLPQQVEQDSFHGISLPGFHEQVRVLLFTSYLLSPLFTSALFLSSYLVSFTPSTLLYSTIISSSLLTFSSLLCSPLLCVLCCILLYSHSTVIFLSFFCSVLSFSCRVLLSDRLTLSNMIRTNTDCRHFIYCHILRLMDGI